MFTSRLGRTIDPNKRVRIYRNLHKPGVIYSVLQAGLVVGYVDRIGLADVRFIVNPAGRDYVRRTGRKVVHAYVEGIVTTTTYPTLGCFASSARYNPRKDNSFVDVGNGKALFAAAFAVVEPTGVQYI